MLTFSQIKVDAFTRDYCDFYCQACAAAKWGSLYIAKLDAGLANEHDGGPKTVSGFEMGEAESREAESFVESHYADTGTAPDWCSTETMEVFDHAPPIECAGGCGRVYTGGQIPWQHPTPEGETPTYVRSADDNRWTGL